MQSKLEATVLNRNHLISKQSKQPRKQIIFPNSNNAQSDIKEKAEPKLLVLPFREPKLKIPSALNSPKYEHRTPLIKSTERGKSYSCTSNNPLKNSKENSSKSKHIHLRRNSRNQSDFYRPPSAANNSKEEPVSTRQEKKIVQENTDDKIKPESVAVEKDSALNILSFRNQMSINKAEKKRVTLIRMGKPIKPRPENVENDEPSDGNRVVIVNPAIEQELFKKYLEADKQTFEFEQLVMAGSYAKSESGSSLLTPNSRTNSDIITPVKLSNVETKLQIITKDSMNTMAGMTTNSTSRNKMSVGAISGVELSSRLELIEWSKEEKSVSNTPNKRKVSSRQSQKNSALKEVQAIKEKILQKKARPKQGSFALAEALTEALNNLKKDKAEIGKTLKKRNLSVQYAAYH